MGLMADSDTHAISFNVWNLNGGPLPGDAIRKIEDAVERAVKSYKKDGVRIMSSTTWGVVVPKEQQ